MSYDAQRLYELLPAIYRIRDLEQGEPLVVRQVVVEGGTGPLERAEDRFERERIGHR